MALDPQNLQLQLYAPTSTQIWDFFFMTSLRAHWNAAELFRLVKYWVIYPAQYLTDSQIREVHVDVPLRAAGSCHQEQRHDQ